MRKIEISVYTISELKELFPKAYEKVIEKEQENISSDDWWQMAHDDLVDQLKSMGFHLKDSEFGFDLYKQKITFEGSLSYQPLSEVVEPNSLNDKDLKWYHKRLNEIQAKYNNAIVFDLGEEAYTRSDEDDEQDDSKNLSDSDFDDWLFIIKQIKKVLLKNLQDDLDDSLLEERIVDYFSTNDSEFFANGSFYYES